LKAVGNGSSEDITFRSTYTKPKGFNTSASNRHLFEPAA